MKRQHPTDPNLFWCPKCKTYRGKGEFGKDKNDPNGIASWCIICRCRKTGLPYKYSKESRAKMEMTQFKKGERASMATEFQKGIIPWNKGKKGIMPRPWNDTNTVVSCMHCGEDIKRKPSQVKKSKHQFCSPECEWKWMYKGGSKAARVELRDTYIRTCLQSIGFNRREIAPETIELKRQQIIMKRTLKQLKDWRKEHESDRDVISGEQREDETVNEVNRRGEETGHGCDCSVSAGM